MDRFWAMKDIKSGEDLWCVICAIVIGNTSSFDEVMDKYSTLDNAVKSEFDEYARRFNQALTNELDVNGSSAIDEAIERFMQINGLAQ